jgi:radical SAM superfamily enzyme YgiQ (UPF0313 family)
MDLFPLDYDMPLYRPPSEGNSLIFQVTLGCSWNRCAFCEMYTSKEFRARPEAEVLDDITAAARAIPDVRKVFLADGNAMVLSSERLSAILDHINASFPPLQRISAYALPKDIMAKTPQELAMLQQKGLKLLYVGIETGDDELLEKINKGETYESTRVGLQKARQAGIKLSVMILTGLGGKTYSHEHAINSARLVNEVQPDYLSTLVLMFPCGLSHFQKRISWPYEPLDTIDVLQEMQWFLSHTQLDRTIFRSDHASNYLALKGILSRDKDLLLKQIKHFLTQKNLHGLRPEWLRGL